MTEIDGEATRTLDCLADGQYINKRGLLYQRQGKDEALSLLQVLTQKVLELGHSIPWAGHLDFQKTQ